MAKDIDSIFFDITPEIDELAAKCEKNNAIDKDLYTKYEVKRGLRDLNGKGVLAGLTNISDVCASKVVNGETVPCEGNLYYRGYNIKDIVKGFLQQNTRDLKRQHICSCSESFLTKQNSGISRTCWRTAGCFRRILCGTLS